MAYEGTWRPALADHDASALDPGRDKPVPYDGVAAASRLVGLRRSLYGVL